MRAWNIYPDHLIDIYKLPQKISGIGGYTRDDETIDRLKEIARKALQPPALPWEKDNVAQEPSCHRQPVFVHQRCSS